MYLDFYGLRESAFNLVTEPRFLYYSDAHCEAMAHLLYGVREKKGVIAMVGEAGTGKTTLIRATLDLLQKSRVISSVLLNPIFEQREDLMDAILRGFGLSGYSRRTLDMADLLQHFAGQHARQSRIPVILVDEAHGLSRELLEDLRLLSNFELGGEKLLQIILSGQPELGERLEAHEFRALRQRITVRCRLQHLSAEETWRYVQHRLRIAGGRGDIFSAEAVEALYVYSGGIARVLNSLADNCLLAGFSRAAAHIDASIVEQVARHLELSPVMTNEKADGSIRAEIMRASETWREVADDLAAGNAVPAALKSFIEKLQAPVSYEPHLTLAMRRGVEA